MKKSLSFGFEVFKIVIIALIIVAPIRFFLFQPFIVKGESMEPNFSDGDYLIVDEISYRFKSPERGEVIVFDPPTNKSVRYIKRVIALPGETVEMKSGKITIYDNNGSLVLDEAGYIPQGYNTFGDVRISLGPDEYFVLGDNRSASLDSRSFGFLPSENIVGRVYLRAWPLDSFTKIYSPAY